MDPSQQQQQQPPQDQYIPPSESNMAHPATQQAAATEQYYPQPYQGYYAPQAGDNPPQYEAQGPPNSAFQAASLATTGPPHLNAPEPPPRRPSSPSYQQPGSGFSGQPLPATSQYAPPPQTHTHASSLEYEDDASSPTSYVRDPHKLVAYLVPFPKPHMPQKVFRQGDASQMPERFLVYTPPPPPLMEPKEGVKEDRMHKLQRKWQNEVRTAKTTNAKVTSWKGVKGRATKGINYAMNMTKSSNLEFLNRIPGKSSPEADHHADDGHQEAETTKKTVGLEEMVLVYPSSLPGTQEQLREEFVNSMLRSKSKAQRDAIIATGLLPVAFAVDVLATVIWPFGGLAEIDAVWGAASIRGAKTARSVTKRLHSTGQDVDMQKNQLRLTFVPSSRVNILQKYLTEQCHRGETTMFRSSGPPPSETDVLHTIGWEPSQTGGETKNWEDEQWESNEVKEDIRHVMGKGAKEWINWCKAFEKDPEKAIKKG